MNDTFSFSYPDILAGIAGNAPAKLLLALLITTGIPQQGRFILAQDQQDSKPIPMTVDEFQNRVKNKNVNPFITELDVALGKSPSDPTLLGLDLQVSQYLLITERGKGMDRFRAWISKVEKLPRTTTIDKLFVAVVFNATTVQDASLAQEFISWIDIANSRVPSQENVTQANLQGNRLSLQALVEDKAQVEVEFTRFYSELATSVSSKKVPVAVFASQAMRYKSLFWNSNREQSQKNLDLARQFYINFMKQGNVASTDVQVYIQFMTTLANEISKDLPQESSRVLKELIDQLRVVQLRIPEEQRNALDATIKNIEQGLKQWDIAIRQMSLIGTQAPEIKDAQYIDVSQELQEKLKGKTVLLAFWAAWSEPCLKSLERIERIREEFQDKEFVVIGVTKFYGMVWDESAKTVERQSEVSQELELKALRSIADYHGTKFGIAVVPESSNLFEQYHVAGIPQLVLIDTNGIVKLVRPGLTESQFKSIEVEIVKLLDQ
jgi:thiol-disulfide isomerase/thioredoxin